VVAASRRPGAAGPGGRAWRALAAGALLIGVAACSNDSQSPATPSPTRAPTDSSASTSAEPTDDSTTQRVTDPKVPAVAKVTVSVTETDATDLDAPWGLAELPDGQLPDGRWLVTERDTHDVLVVADGASPKIVTGGGATDLRTNTAGSGEAGLLGVAVSPTFADDHLVFFYRTGEDGNEVLSGELTGTSLGELTPILTGIPAGSTHNGGRLAFGPDGYLYISTGDTGTSLLAQNPDSLGGKILRIASDGAIPNDNPIPDSPLWSLGHRNVQGMGWSSDGRMFASEFGADNLDELNLIVAGGNYGWPDYEGPGGVEDGYIDPLVTWMASAASPSGLAVTDEGVYLAALRGEALLRIPLAADGVGEPQRLLDGDYGRLRAVAVADDGTLRVLTSNTDGRGDTRDGDDRMLTVAISE
jgi:glucose/arabinose dehydrogenase